MTTNPSIESAAESAYRKYRERYHADIGPSAWGELGDAQREIWRDVARAALEATEGRGIMTSEVSRVRVRNLGPQKVDENGETAFGAIITFVDGPPQWLLSVIWCDEVLELSRYNSAQPKDKPSFAFGAFQETGE